MTYGTTGLIVIIILGLLVPIVGALVWQIRATSKAFTAEIAASREERERQAELTDRAFSEISTRYREERREDSDRYERLSIAQVSTLGEQSNAMRKLCSALEQRPCIVGTGGLLNNPSRDASDGEESDSKG